MRSALVALCVLLMLSVQEGRAGEPARLSALRYDYEYPVIGYSGNALNNRAARLQLRLERGELQLQFQGSRGYLDSLLKALQIDPSSQTLVFSKTSLQIEWIEAATPRALYFNEDTFVAWVQGSGLLEMVAMDSSLGPVFYTLDNHEAAPARFDREVLRCLACHDKFSLAGGGVPEFLVASSPVDVNGMLPGTAISSPVSDETPIEKRWAGWYVTGGSSEQSHLGNILAHSEKEFLQDARIAPRKRTDLVGLLDTTPYPNDKSDVVALLVLEHQTTVYNLITRLNFKARTLLSRESPGAESTLPWESLQPRTQEAIRHMAEPLVQAMLFSNAAPIAGKIAGSSFDALPDCARQFIYRRLADMLDGRDQSAASARLSVQDRTAVAQILTATKPEFANTLRQEPLR